MFHDIFDIAVGLEEAGLLWQPEIGDEVSDPGQPEKVSILVDPKGLKPAELREMYVWLPTIEQMVLQLEVRQAVLFHAGLELSNTNFFYKAVIQGPQGSFEARASNLRAAVGFSFRDMLISNSQAVH